MKKRSKRQIVAAPQLITGIFALLILLGTVLLSIPITSNTGETNFLDALFTATSAVCVTGLTTLSIVDHYNILGQFILLVLIEIGGIGFMSIPVFFYVLGKRRVTFSTRLLLRETLNLEQKFGEIKLAWSIIRISIIIQLSGALLLAIKFVPRFGWGKGLWYSFFHAVSSFCNAGFDLFGNSLMNFQRDSWVLMVISFLIIAGGLGFFVWDDLLNIKTQKLSLHSRLAIYMTLSLLGLGFIAFLIGHRSSTIANAFFLSVTPRTAGFYSVNYSKMSHAGIMLTMILMFIGGTSGSTAGGLKTTTFGVILLKVRSIFKGRSRAEFHGRTIKESTISRGMTLFFLTLSIGVVSIMLLSITETIPKGFGLEYIAFEVISAMGTVGLTLGLTSDLTVFGKLLIIFLMFIGRVGIMTVTFSLVVKARQQEAHYKYPEENVMIG